MSRLLCKCMDPNCTNEHFDPVQGIQIIEEGSVPPENLEVDGGVLFLRQDFEVPEGAYPVRMQVGDLPVTIIGWTNGEPGSLTALLRNVADELEKIENDRDSAGS